MIKNRTHAIRFLMITGVSKFTKMSIFSTLSNLIDISFDDDYATMLGYTEAELDEYFSDRMQAQAGKMGLTYDAYRAELRRLYNGYRFWKKRGENVYNPVSINLNLAKARPLFEHYWSSTGHASMLMNILHRACRRDALGAQGRGGRGGEERRRPLPHRGHELELEGDCPRKVVPGR